jgi:hypothetical protein
MTRDEARRIAINIAKLPARFSGRMVRLFCSLWPGSNSSPSSRMLLVAKL